MSGHKSSDLDPCMFDRRIITKGTNLILKYSGLDADLTGGYCLAFLN